MGLRLVTTVCSLFLLAVASPASAEVLIDIDFDENDFATQGAELNGLAGWTTTIDLSGAMAKWPLDRT